MAKLNTKHGKLLARLIDPQSSRVYAFRSDGIVLRWTPFGWKRYARIKKDRSPEQVISDFKAQGWIETRPPTYQTLKKWAEQGIAKTPCGCKTESDGRCQHGRPSWLIIAGLI